MSVAMRFVGPVIGYGFASICLLFYEKPFYDPQIARTDPRFIGAWWPGFLLLAIFLFLSSLPLFFFPRRFKVNSRNATFPNPQTIDPRTFAGFLVKSKRVLRNVPLLYKTFGGTMSILSLGYVVYLQKYFKAQFRKSQSEANFFSGFVSHSFVSLRKHN
ncbi:Solute carrier organic anion transporter family member 3A1-like protein [Leptotrombidium deliense]|uniref:Solute carrier organic anion transporter family member 3A1-like protein n=1 Tax=Leptotrombidium deliense TaxID=299467 RepID=A0A443SLQ5_9ACAR|nr:Solute carrier organic anion transporter family member 3A1-like protein [Leptotrombidium deliense]